MELSKKVLDALNEQMKNEFFSEMVYLSMAAHFDLQELKGIGQWMRLQATEEHSHGMKIFEFVLERDSQPELLSIAKPHPDFKSPVQVFEEALSHEQIVTKMINDLYELAQSEKDHATRIFLEWFVNEQVEEESTARTNLGKIKLAKDSKDGLLILDAQFAKRK